MDAAMFAQSPSPGKQHVLKVFHDAAKKLSEHENGIGLFGSKRTSAALMLVEGLRVYRFGTLLLQQGDDNVFKILCLHYWKNRYS